MITVLDKVYQDFFHVFRVQNICKSAENIYSRSESYHPNNKVRWTSTGSESAQLRGWGAFLASGDAMSR